MTKLSQIIFFTNGAPYLIAYFPILIYYIEEIMLKQAFAKQSSCFKLLELNQTIQHCN